MASAVASKGAPSAALLKKLLAAPSASGEALAYKLRPAAVASARRLFNSGGAPLRSYDDEDEEDYEESIGEGAADDRRRARAFSVPMFFSSGTMGPHGAPTTLGRLLALMADAAPVPSGLAPRRGWWVAKEDDDAVLLKVPMPGLGKEHVKVWAEPNCLVIKGEGDKEPADGDDDGEETGPPRFTRRIDLPADAFKMDQIKAEMKNGMLRVTVPTVKEEERKDVFHVKVE